MARTPIDTDDDVVAQVRAIIGTSTTQDTVNATPASVLARQVLRQFLIDARAGALADMADPEISDHAWRR